MNEVVIDTNLLLLLVVGAGSPQDIGRHKRLTPVFAIEQFELLRTLLAPFQRWVATPHVLTETDYFVRQSSGASGERSLAAFRTLIASGFIEMHQPAASIAMEPEFNRLGLADTGQILVAAKSRTLLTADAPLYAAALSRGAKALNFWHEWRAQMS
jgi:predicted nucleic acid-binding protein